MLATKYMMLQLPRINTANLQLILKSQTISQTEFKNIYFPNTYVHVKYVILTIDPVKF